MIGFLGEGGRERDGTLCLRIGTMFRSLGILRAGDAASFVAKGNGLFELRESLSPSVISISRRDILQRKLLVHQPAVCPERVQCELAKQTLAQLYVLRTHIKASATYRAQCTHG